MKLSTRIILIASGVLLFLRAGGYLAFGQGVVDEVDRVVKLPVWPFYLVAVGIAIWVGILVNKMARSNTRVELEDIPEEERDRQLESALEKELSGYVGSKTERSQIVRSLAQVVDQKVSQVTQEIKGEYDTLLAQKDRDQEITHLKYKNLVAEKNQTEAIVQSLAEGLVVVNGKGEVVMMNPAAEKLLGVNKSDKVGKPLTDQLKGEEIVSLVSNVAGSEEKTVELSSAQQETKKIIRSSSALVENENGQTIGMVSVLTDVTKQRELDRLKTQFVSNVTHELRTPIVATQKALVVMADAAAGPLTDDQKRFLDIATRNLDRLSRLINDILDFSKLEAGKMKLELATTQMETVLTEVCDTLNSWANSKEINLEKKIEAGLGLVDIDAFRIIQVLNNLVSNALKFTPKGGKVTVEARKSKEPGQIEVIVRDTGAGIAKEDLGRVFERFLQVGERKQTDVGGTGLGLSIAREIIELHGGKIWAESPEGGGAEFIFVLPERK